MEDQKVIIVGATSGIGRALAEQYLARGFRVGATGRRLELLEELRAAFPGSVCISRFDVTKPGSVAYLRKLVDDLGGLDVLIISAGYGKPSEKLNWEIDKTTIETNVNGFTEIANWAFNHFISTGHGRLAAISSIAAERGNHHAPSYSASKSFISIYCEGLSIKAYKLKKNISITCIEPGFVNTKAANTQKRFWVVPVEKAARQIISAISSGKRKVYISRRWWIVAKLMRCLPNRIYRRI